MGSDLAGRYVLRRYPAAGLKLDLHAHAMGPVLLASLGPPRSLPNDAGLASAMALQMPITDVVPNVQAPAVKTGPTEDGQVGMNTQWASGSNPPDTDILSLANHVLYQQGHWQAEINGSGLLNSVLNAPPVRTSQGKINDYIVQLNYKQGSVEAHARLGLISPALFCDAQFVTDAIARRGVEFTLHTPAGTFGGFSNFNDAAAGGGFGMNIHQKIRGASWEAPLPQWVQFRMMWLSGDDIGVPNSTGDVYGGLLNIHIKQKWLISSEYAVSHDNPDTSSSASTRAFGRAWRAGVSGQPGRTNLSLAYHDVSANFGNPTNPGLTPNGQPNVRGVDSAITQTAKAGTFGLTYTFLANNVKPTTSDELLLNTFDESWSRPFGTKTNVAVDARQSLTSTGTVPAALVGLSPSVTGAQDTRDLSGSINLSRQGAQRDYLHRQHARLEPQHIFSLEQHHHLVAQCWGQSGHTRVLPAEYTGQCELGGRRWGRP